MDKGKVENMEEMMNRNVTGFSVVIPVYNEEGNIAELYNRLKKVMDSLSSSYEIIFVDDGSKDASFSILKDLAEKDKNVEIIKFTRNFGHQLAITAGLDHCVGEHVVLMDADLQDQPEEIPKLYEAMGRDYDAVYGIRVDRQDSWLKMVLANLFISVLNFIAREKIIFNISTFIMIKKRVVVVLRNMHERHRMLDGMISWLGFSCSTVKVNHGKRYSGRAKYTLVKSLKLALDAVASFSCLPLQMATYIGFFVAGLSILWGLRLYYQWLIYGMEVPGFATLSIGMFFLGGIQLIILGAIGEYIGRMYSEEQKRPLYVIDEIVKTS